jgi:glycosyltransferase involved in cell wall biosynthesis
MQTDKSTEDWLDRFVAAHGRRPRVLHIGNIGNNAYLNAKMLNNAGLDCDVLCYDYFHIMGCPEWEDADFEGDVGDQFAPNWKKVDLHGFQRPPWFIQETLYVASHYLIARRSGRASWLKAWQVVMRLKRPRHIASRLGRSLKLPGIVRRMKRVYFGSVRLLERVFKSRRLARSAPVQFQIRCQALMKEFSRSFPNRQDGLLPNDIWTYMESPLLWNKLLANYDAVVGYSTDGVYPLLAGKRPYFAYEHGTIRNIPFEATAQGRACALTYRLADGCFITNSDNIVAAGKLGLDNYRFIPHPVNEDIGASLDPVQLRRGLGVRLDSDFIAFHPSRQHWEDQRHPDWEKGNDIFIRGFAKFVKETNPRAGAVFVQWGKTVEKSKALLDSLGVRGRVIWVDPMPNRSMIAYIQACDVLADHFFLGGFTSTMPKALRHGCPAMLYLDPRCAQWCMPEMPPVVNARDEQQVFDGLTRLYRDASYTQELIDSGKAWYQKYHSNAVIVRTFMEAFGQVLR